MKLHAVVASRNIPNEWLQECLDGILAQKGVDLHITWTDDASPNGTPIALSSCGDDRLTVVENTHRRGGLANWIACIDTPSEIVVPIGGDDIVDDPYAFQRIRYIHESGAWLTYGSMTHSDGSHPPSGRMFHYDYRHHPYAWMPVSVRSDLVLKINHADLQSQGYWFQSAGDSAFIFPLLEMSGSDRIHFIPEKWYRRRMHEGNDHVQDAWMQSFLGHYARCKPKYSRLRDLSDTPMRQSHTLRIANAFVPSILTKGAFLKSGETSNGDFELSGAFNWLDVYDKELMVNPYRFDVHADPFEIFFAKHKGTPQLLLGGSQHPDPPKYTRGFPYAPSDGVPDDELWLVVDAPREIVGASGEKYMTAGEYEKFPRERFERDDVLVNPETGERVQ